MRTAAMTKKGGFVSVANVHTGCIDGCYCLHPQNLHPEMLRMRTMPEGKKTILYLLSIAGLPQ